MRRYLDKYYWLVWKIRIKRVFSLVRWVGVDGDGIEVGNDEDLGRYPNNAYKQKECWCGGNIRALPKGTIKLLTGKDIRWEDECIEVKGLHKQIYGTLAALVKR
jgi:hypothetical protein